MAFLLLLLTTGLFAGSPDAGSPGPASPRRANAVEPRALPGGVEVRWKEKRYAPSRLPSDFPPGARAAALAWESFAEGVRYDMDLVAGDRILLISRSHGSRLERQIEWIEKTAELFDRSLPAPTRQGDLAPLVDLGPADEPIPEDPDEQETAAAPSASSASWTTSWGAASQIPDTEIVSFFVVRDEDDFDLLLEHIASAFPELGTWAHAARKQPGFVIGLPICGSLVELADGQEEWDGDNEIVSRVSRLLFLRRFGQQPPWLSLGWAWHAEFRLRKTVYVFPYRDEFVGVGEHSDWDKQLRRWFKKRPDHPLRAEEFADWPPRTFSDTHAKIAWGVVEYLARRENDALPDFLEELRVFRDADDRTDLGGGMWERDPEYEVPLDVQEEMIERHFGADFLERVTEFFVMGMPD